jgi:hypothetical protein
MNMETDNFVDNDEYFREIRQGIIDAIYGKNIQVVFAVLRDIFISTLAQCEPSARWSVANNFRRDTAQMLVEANAMGEAVRRDPTLVLPRARV